MTRGEIPFGFASKALTNQFAFVGMRRLFRLSQVPQWQSFGQDAPRCERLGETAGQPDPTPFHSPQPLGWGFSDEQPP